MENRNFTVKVSPIEAYFLIKEIEEQFELNKYKTEGKVGTFLNICKESHPNLVIMVKNSLRKLWDLPSSPSSQGEFFQQVNLDNLVKTLKGYENKNWDDFLNDLKKNPEYSPADILHPSKSELDRMGVKFEINTKEDIDEYFNNPDDFLFEGKRFLLGWYPLKYSLIESVDSGFEFKVIESKGMHKKAGKNFWIPRYIYLSEDKKDFFPDIMIDSTCEWFQEDEQSDLREDEDYFYL